MSVHADLELNAVGMQVYLAGAAKLRGAVVGLLDADLDAFPVPGTWSIRQIVVHVVHADLFASLRMQQVLAEDNPLIMTWDENRFITRLPSQKVAMDVACDLLDHNRQFTASFLGDLGPADLARTAVHSQQGKVVLADLFKYYTRHLDHHLEFIHKKRGMLGK